MYPFPILDRRLKFPHFALYSSFRATIKVSIVWKKAYIVSHFFVRSHDIVADLYQ